MAGNILIKGNILTKGGLGVLPRKFFNLTLQIMHSEAFGWLLTKNPKHSKLKGILLPKSLQVTTHAMHGTF